jgi:hypothetical protein
MVSYEYMGFYISDIHSFNKYWLNTKFVPDYMVTNYNTVVNKDDTVLAIMKLQTIQSNVKKSYSSQV